MRKKEKKKRSRCNAADKSKDPRYPVQNSQKTLKPLSANMTCRLAINGGGGGGDGRDVILFDFVAQLPDPLLSK